MISFDEAFAIVKAAARPLGTERVALVRLPDGFSRLRSSPVSTDRAPTSRRWTAMRSATPISAPFHAGSELTERRSRGLLTRARSRRGHAFESSPVRRFHRARTGSSSRRWWTGKATKRSSPARLRRRKLRRKASDFAAAMPWSPQAEARPCVRSRPVPQTRRRGEVHEQRGGNRGRGRAEEAGATGGRRTSRKRTLGLEGSRRKRGGGGRSPCSRRLAEMTPPSRNNRPGGRVVAHRRDRSESPERNLTEGVDGSKTFSPRSRSSGSRYGWAGSGGS